MVNEKKVSVLDEILENVEKSATRRQVEPVIKLLSNIISSLLHNENTNDEDKEFLKKLSKNMHVYKYFIFNSNEYKTVQEMYDIYKQSIDSFHEVTCSKKLITELKEIVTKYEINQKPVGLDMALKEIESKFQKTANSKIKKLDTEIEKGLAKSKEMLGDTADNINAKRYLDYAANNKKAARWLFWVSILIMILVAFMALYHFWNIEKIEISKIWNRISLTLLMLLPTFFMMREAKKLKDKEFQYYDIACRILTSEPYIDGLSIDSKEKAKLKADLVKSFFAKTIECRDDGGLVPTDQICEIIKSCLNRG